MTRIRSKVLDRTIEVTRIIGHIKGSTPGPTVVFIAGIHGNEPSGVFALHEVINHLTVQDIQIKGSIYAISGNLYALERGIRYDKVDLNRLWTDERMRQLNNETVPKNQDITEQLEIKDLLENILSSEKGPFYFMDLHTTSSESIPFLTVNDSLLNRWFTAQYPLPIILGIEEYLDGPVLSYMNELGYVSFGFEAGQHNDLSTFENQEAFIFTTLVLTESVKANDINYQHFRNVLAKTSVESQGVYEIFYKYEIHDSEVFQMQPGFVNFHPIHKKQLLATSNGNNILSNHKARIFMPLYQAQGNDGYFIIRRVRKIFLRLSEILRRLKFDKVLPLLPGIRWYNNKQTSLVVNLTIAKFFAKQLFHLLGYRNKQKDRTHLIIKNRETAAKFKDYQNTSWVD